MLDVLKDLEFKTFLAFNVISMEQATPQKDRFLFESQTGVFSKEGLQVLNMEVGTRLRGEWLVDRQKMLAVLSSANSCVI